MKLNHDREFELSDSIDIQHLLRLLRANIWIFVFGFLIAGGAAFIASKLQTPVYAASTQVLVTRAESQGPVTDVTQTLSAQQVAQTYVELLSQKWIVEKVSERLGFEVDEDSVNVSQTINTPIIDIEAEDADPARAALIADMLVKVLIEQNENIQSGRYSSAEESLNLQIQKMEEQIAAAQAELVQANEGAYASQLLDAQASIQNTQAAIDGAKAEISKLRSLVSTDQVEALLSESQVEMKSLQTKLEGQLAEYQRMSDDLAGNPLVKTDPAYGPSVQAKMAELGVAINGTRQEIDTLSQEIAYLTPLSEPGALSKAIAEERDYLTSQEALLVTYQDAYTALQVSGKIAATTNEITTLENNLKLYQEIYLNLLNNRETIRLERIQNMPNVVQANPAIATEDPVRPRTVLNTILGGMAGLILALSAVMLMDFLDTTIKTRENVERAVPGLSVLGYVLPLPTSKEQDGPYVLHAPRSPAAEAFRSLRTNLEFISVDKPLKSLLISSSGAGEGKTITSANLGAIFAQGGKNVVILDSDLRRPRLHREMGIPNRVGLSDIFRGKAAIEQTIQPYKDLNLSVITSGGIPPNPAELLGSAKMGQILDELEARFDLVVIDTTPTIVTDSQLVAARVDGVLLIARAGETQANAIRATVEQYNRVGARLLGVILNNVVPGNGYVYPYYNNYQYYHYDQDDRVSKGFTFAPSMPWRGKKKPVGEED